MLAFALAIDIQNPFGVYFQAANKDGPTSTWRIFSVSLYPQAKKFSRFIGVRGYNMTLTLEHTAQQTGAFCYHFWLKHMPKLSHYKKAGEVEPLLNVKDEQVRRKILETVRVIEMHMALSCTAMWTLQILSIHLTGRVSSDQLRYQRTTSKGRVSEAAVMYYVWKHIFRLMGKIPKLCITKIIQSQQSEETEFLKNPLIS